MQAAGTTHRCTGADTSRPRRLPHRPPASGRRTGPLRTRICRDVEFRRDPVTRSRANDDRLRIQKFPFTSETPNTTFRSSVNTNGIFVICYCTFHGLLSARSNGGLRNGEVHLFVCLSVCSFVCRPCNVAAATNFNNSTGYT